MLFLDFPGGTVIRNLFTNAVDSTDVGSVPGLGRSPGVGNNNPTPVFLPGKSHGQRSLVGYSSWGRKEADKMSDCVHSLFLCRW